jgi:hypothetical protein
MAETAEGTILASCSLLFSVPGRRSSSSGRLKFSTASELMLHHRNSRGTYPGPPESNCYVRCIRGRLADTSNGARKEQRRDSATLYGIHAGNLTSSSTAILTDLDTWCSLRTIYVMRHARILLRVAKLIVHNFRRPCLTPFHRCCYRDTAAFGVRVGLQRTR